MYCLCSPTLLPVEVSMPQDVVFRGRYFILPAIRSSTADAQTETKSIGP